MSLTKRVCGILLATATVRYRIFWLLLLRMETFAVFVTIGGIILYTKWLAARYRPLMQGKHLEKYALSHRFKFQPPKFMDLGLSDIPRFHGGTWRWKHQNLSFFASRGQRPYMEDRMHYMNDPYNNLSIFSIFDGHGGPFVSQYLEKNFSHAMRTRLLRFSTKGIRPSIISEDPCDRVTQAIITEVHNIDDAISRMNPSLTAFTGSTLISVILEHNRFLTVVNVGDSRAVACDSAGRAFPLSADHKPSDLKERRRIENAGGYIEFNGVDRVQGILSVTRAFGDTALKRLCVLTATPDVVRVDLSEISLRFILVASDGFWDVMSNEDAVEFANSFLATTPILRWQRVAEHLVQEALQRGTEDNVSVLAINCQQLNSNQALYPDPLSLSDSDTYYVQLLANASSHTEHVSLVNRIAYGYIAPIVITSGIIGDVLTIATLTHPMLRRSNIVYVYLILLAMTDLLMHCSIIPMILFFLDYRLCSYSSALYYAHIGFPLVNAFMGASVWIVVFLTMNQYVAVCYPLYGDFLRSRKLCFSLFIAAYVINFCIYAPWAAKKSVFQLPKGIAKCEYIFCEYRIETWFKVYEWIRETISRLLPFVLVAFFNVRILVAYRSRKRTLQNSLANNKTTLNAQSEERRLFVLLFSIIIIFFVCTIPAAPLTIFVSDKHSRNGTFQVFRAAVNMIEITKFALNFYFYCLINPGIRRIFWETVRCKKLAKQALIKGQPVNPISLYGRSSKGPSGVVVTCSRSSTRRSDFTESRKSSLTTFTGSKPAPVNPSQNGNIEKVTDKLTAISESTSSISNELVNHISII